MNQKINVEIIYRNYKPLHKIHQSLIETPPENIEYKIPVVKDSFITQTGFKAYRRFGRNKNIVKIFKSFQNNVLSTEEVSSETDIIHYIQLVPPTLTEKPYVVEIEHAAGLFSFLAPDEETRSEALHFLLHPNCKKVISLSNSATESFATYFSGEQLEQILSKTVTIYPASKNYSELYKRPADEDPPFKILFVGNDVYRKGLHELLEAVSEVPFNENIQLTVIANLPSELYKKYPPSQQIVYREPNFSREEILEKFYSRSDIFAFPTHLDTFGMAVLDALSCGTPVVTTKQFALKEIVKENRNGVFVHSDRLYFEEDNIIGTDGDRSERYYPKQPEEKLVNSIRDVIERLYNDRNLINAMSSEAVKDFEEGGRFSIGERNSKLSQVYREALKK